MDPQEWTERIRVNITAIAERDTPPPAIMISIKRGILNIFIISCRCYSRKKLKRFYIYADNKTNTVLLYSKIIKIDNFTSQQISFILMVHI